MLPINEKDALPALLSPREKLDAKALAADMQGALTDASWFQTVMRDNEALRTCYWPGQTADGRKHGTVDQPALPYENAADHRVPLIQELMNERTRIRLRAIKAAQLDIKGRSIDDQRRAGQLKQAVNYHLKTEMDGEMDRELRYLSNWCQNDGHSVLFVGWQVERQLEERKITRQTMQQIAAAQAEARLILAMQEVGAAPDAMQVQTAREDAMRGVIEQLATDGGALVLVDLLLVLDDDLVEMGVKGRAEALRAIKQLRTKDEASYHAVFVKRSCPKWEALRAYIDVFYPTETRDLRESRWIARVRWLTMAQLLEWADAEKLDPDFIREVQKNPGKCFDVTQAANWVLGSGGTRLAGLTSTTDENRRRYQVVEVYWRAHTSFGVPVLYRTIAHGKVTRVVGKHEVCQHYHGEYPFHELREEWSDKLLLSSRGVPELLGTAQHAIKAQWDARTNNASMGVLPPMTGPAGSTPPAYGPGVYIEQPRGGDVEWMQPPPYDGRSIEIEKTIDARADRLYGRMSANVPEALQVLHQGALAEDVLLTMKRALRQTVQLIQQYTPDITGRRITGTEDFVTFTREEIQGQFDIETEFDARDLSLEWIEQKLKLYTSLLLPLDNRGIINRGEIIRTAAQSVDPGAADRFVQNDTSAEAREIAEEDSALNAIFSGSAKVDFAVGVNHEARSQHMINDMNSSPVRKRILATQEEIRLVWEDRLQRHLMQLQQEQNKITGTQGGADPLQQSPLSQLKAGGFNAFVR